MKFSKLFVGDIWRNEPMELVIGDDSRRETLLQSLQFLLLRGVLSGQHFWFPILFVVELYLLGKGAMVM